MTSFGRCLTLNLHREVADNSDNPILIADYYDLYLFSKQIQIQIQLHTVGTYLGTLDVHSCAMASATTDESALLTLPLDLLKTITHELEPADETALKATCKRMNLLIAEPPAPAPIPAASGAVAAVAAAATGLANLNFLAVRSEPRDGRSTPVPQSPLPYKAAQTLAELEHENRDVEHRERERGMELSDTEDGYESGVGDGRRLGKSAGDNKPTKFRGKNILSWQAELGSAPASPSAAPASFVNSPRAGSPTPSVPSFTVSRS